MIKNIYTLQEAFRIGLLEECEVVDLKPLYMPYKKKLIKSYVEEYRIFSLRYVSTSLGGRIYHRAGSIFVMCDLKLPITNYSSCPVEKLCSAVCDLLSNEMYKIKATCKDANTYKIEIGPDINVKFVGEDEIPTLILPEHTAYTC